MYSNTLFLVSENNFQKYRFQWVSSPKDYPFRFYPLIFCGAGKRATFYLLFIYLSLTQIQWYVINPKGGLTWTAYIWACIMNRIWMLRLIEERRNSEVSNLKSHTKSEIQTSWGPSTLHSHSVHHGHHPSIYHEFTFVP